MFTEKSNIETMSVENLRPTKRMLRQSWYRHTTGFIIYSLRYV